MYVFATVMCILLGLAFVGGGAVKIKMSMADKNDMKNLFVGIIWIGMGIAMIVINAMNIPLAMTL